MLLFCMSIYCLWFNEAMFCVLSIMNLMLLFEEYANVFLSFLTKVMNVSPCSYLCKQGSCYANHTLNGTTQDNTMNCILASALTLLEVLDNLLI